MNKKLAVLAAVGLCVAGLNAQVIEVDQDWKLLGATEDISNVSSVFSQDKVQVYWTFGDGGWSNDAQTISKGQGFWIKGVSSATIDTNDASSTSGDTNYMSGRTFTITDDPVNFTEGYVKFVLNGDQSGTETGYYKNGSLEYQESITWSWDESSYKLRVDLQDGTYSITTFNSNPTQGSTASHFVSDDSEGTMNITVTEFE